MKINDGSYNIRVNIKDGHISLGFIHKCYKKGNNWEWKDVPDSVREKFELIIAVNEFDKIII